MLCFVKEMQKKNKKIKTYLRNTASSAVNLQETKKRNVIYVSLS